jgi:ATP-binding cassette subfamily F protein 3
MVDMIVLAAQKIGKSFGIQDVLDDISLHLREKERIGLIGNNGSGKTTLMRILAGEIEPDTGTVSKRKGLRIGYLEQHASFESDRTLMQVCLDVFAEVIALGKKVQALAEEVAGLAAEDASYEKTLADYQHAMDAFEQKRGYQTDSLIRGVLHGLGFTEEHYERRVSTFSGGQKSRVLLARLLLQEPDVLLMDEPTNHLDLQAVAWLESFLKEYKGTLLVISHDRYFLDAVTTRTAFLDDRIETYEGNYTRFMEKRRQAREVQAKAYANQQKEIKRQEEIIRRYENYGGERYLIQARSRRKMLERMDRVEKPEQDAASMRLALTPKRTSGKDVLDMEGLGMRFGEKKLFAGVDLHIERGERTGIIGPNGVGKTTLFRILRGEVQPTEGGFALGTGVRLGFLDQEQKDLHAGQSVIEEVWDSKPQLTHGEIRNILAAFLFYGDDVFKSVDDLSGGERARVALCKLMLSESNLLLLDEPTNHLDMDSKEALEEACLHYTGTLLFISHDRYFLNRVAGRILEMKPDGLDSYLGNYDYYVEKQREADAQETVEVNRTQVQKTKRKDRENRQEEKRKRQEKSHLEEEIRTLEETIIWIDRQLGDSAFYENPNEVRALAEKREETQRRIDALYEAWIGLADG